MICLLHLDIFNIEHLGDKTFRYYLILWKRVWIKLREDRNCTRGKHGDINGTNDYDMKGRPGAGGYREHDILVIKNGSVENITKFPFGQMQL